MSLTFGFYNSVSGDRVYNAVQISSIFDGVIEDGVFSSIGSKLMVIPGTGMNVIVGTGRAWFDHSWTNNDSPLVLSVATANAAWTRKDIVVLEVNSDNAVRANSLKIITGVPALNPVLPTLTNTEYVHQYPLAYLEIGPNVTEVNASKITNMVGSDQTPYVIGVVNTISIADLMAQFESQFSNWFEEMKDQLSTDAAGNLQNQIDALEARTVFNDTPNVTTDIIVNKAVTFQKIENVGPYGVLGNMYYNSRAVQSLNAQKSGTVLKRLYIGGPINETLGFYSIINQRRGANANNWDQPGTYTTVPTSSEFAVGTTPVTGAVTTVAFPFEFAYNPIIIPTFYDPGDTSPADYLCYVIGITTLQALVRVRKVGGGTLPAGGALMWLAIGPSKQ